MADILETRESGIEILDDNDIDAELEENMVVDAVHFRTEDTVRVEVGESVGNAIYVEGDHFLAVAIDGEVEDELQLMMMEEEDPEVKETSIFLSNEDGEMGGGVLRIEDVADTEQALRQFEDENL